MTLEKPVILRIKRITDEAQDLKTFYFDCRLNAKPGQFVMLWIPGVDEKPFSISYQDEKSFGITVMKVGGFTQKMFGLKEGGNVGIRGPYGNGFKIEGNKIADRKSVV